MLARPNRLANRGTPCFTSLPGRKPPDGCDHDAVQSLKEVAKTVVDTGLRRGRATTSEGRKSAATGLSRDTETLNLLIPLTRLLSALRVRFPFTSAGGLSWNAAQPGNPQFIMN